MPPAAPKPYTTPERQIAILQDRGLKITDAARAADNLRRIGYYRLSGYCKPFQAAGSERFVSGASFDDVIALYVFDNRLRLTMMDMLGRIEVAVRAAIADRMGAKDPQAHHNRDLLRGDSADNLIDDWLAMRERQMTRHCRDAIVKHCREKYATPPPVWAEVELWSFGALSKFYGLMRLDDQRAVAARFGVAHVGCFQSWLRAMGFTRNVAAHHRRLWNVGIVGHPKLPGDVAGFDPPLAEGKKSAERIYAVLCIAVFLSRRVCPGSEWPRRLRALLTDKFPRAPGRDPREMGFPPKWESGDFWNR